MYPSLESAKAVWQGRASVLVAYDDKHLGSRVEIVQGADTAPDAPTYSVYRYWKTSDGTWNVSADMQNFPAPDIFRHMAEQLGDLFDS